MQTTITQAFAEAVRRDPTTPLLTWYDDASGDRTELSGATLDNWVSKTANLLIDGAGLSPGDTVAVLLPPHWQTAAVLLATLAAGLTADGSGSAADAVFATPENAEKSGNAAERYATGLLPLAMPLRTVPPSFVDYVTEVRNYGDHFRGVPIDPESEAFPGRTHRELAATAAERAAERGIKPGDRVLIDAGKHPDPVDWLLAPIVAGASIVLCGHLDPSKIESRAATEKVTVVV